MGLLDSALAIQLQKSHVKPRDLPRNFESGGAVFSPPFPSTHISGHLIGASPAWDCSEPGPALTAAVVPYGTFVTVHIGSQMASVQWNQYFYLLPGPCIWVLILVFKETVLFRFDFFSYSFIFVTWLYNFEHKEMYLKGFQTLPYSSYYCSLF